MKNAWSFWLLLCISLLPGVGVRGQDPLELDPEPGSAWEEWGLAFTPYAWLASQATDVGGRRLRQSFNDLASITNVGFQGRVVARYRWVILNADYTYADQNSAVGIGRTTLDFQLSQHILDVKVGGKVYDSRTSARDGGVAVWVLAGARYWDNTVDFTITTEPVLPSGDPTVVSDRTGQSYWDPVLGVNFHWPVTPSVGFAIRTTGGGLGIGDASDYMWDGEFVALFRLGRRFLASAGYRSMKFDRTDGEGDEELRQTVTVNGPSLGISIAIF